MTKAEIRKEVKEKREHLKRRELESLSKVILDKLLKLDAYQECDKIFTYLSMGSEVDTHILVKQARADGKRIFLPRVEGKRLEFYEIDDLFDLELSRFGVLEPRISEAKRYTLPGKRALREEESKDKWMERDKVNLMIIPGLAFDSGGNRIGYGGGYYDRYLNLIKDIPALQFYKVALAFDFQLYPQIPVESFDIPVDEIITPTRRIICQKELIVRG